MATEASCSTSTSSPSKADRDATIEAFNHLVQGKRHLLVQDIPSAVSSLEEACQLLTAHYGELANECGDAYFYYGKALFELAREETGVFGNAIGNEEDKDDDDDDDDEDEDDNEDSNTNEDGNDEDAQESQEDDEEEQSDKSEELLDEDKENKPSPSESEATGVVKPSPDETDPQVAGTSSGKTRDKDDEGEEEITNLQLAWEMLELAKVIFSRQAENNREMELKLAEVYLYLGEVSLESGNYVEAINDMKHCLKVQQMLLPKDDRRIAETYYQLGLTYSYDNANDLAIESFRNACKVIEEKIASLKVITDGKEIELGKIFMNDDDPVAVAQREIEDLTAILPDLRDKITDLEDAKKNIALAVQKAAEKSIEEIQESIGQISSTSSSVPKVEKPTSNITHLLKRKRKSDNAVDGSSTDVKRVRTDIITSNASNLQQCDSNETVTNSTSKQTVESKTVESSSEAQCENSDQVKRVESPHSSTVDSSSVVASDKEITSSQKEPESSSLSSSSMDSKCPVSSSSMKDETNTSNEKLCNGNRDSSEVQ